MSPRFVIGREIVPCVAEVFNRSLKADCTDFTMQWADEDADSIQAPTLTAITQIESS